MSKPPAPSASKGFWLIGQLPSGGCGHWGAHECVISSIIWRAELAGEQVLAAEVVGVGVGVVAGRRRRRPVVGLGARRLAVC